MKAKRKIVLTDKPKRKINFSDATKRRLNIVDNTPASFSIISEVAEGAYVYHNGYTIKGVSFVPDLELEDNYEKIIIPVDIAVKFVNGDLPHYNWFVWNNKLYSNNISKIDSQIELNLVDKKFVLIEEISGNIQPWLTIKIYLKSQHVVFKLASFMDVANLKYDTVEKLSFIFTEEKDPTSVLYKLDIPTAELFEKGYDFVLPIKSGKRVNIYTRRLFPNYSVEYSKSIMKTLEDGSVEEEEVLLSLPKNHFVDLKMFSKSPTNRGLQAVIDRPNKTINFSLVGEDIETYDRSMASLKVLFSKPRDPTQILQTEKVPMDMLQNGELVTFMLSDHLLEKDFDLWSPLVYRNACVVERDEIKEKTGYA